MESPHHIAEVRQRHTIVAVVYGRLNQICDYAGGLQDRELAVVVQVRKMHIICIEIFLR